MANARFERFADSQEVHVDSDGERSTPKLKILVIDDEAPIRRALRRLLQLKGYEVHEAENGAQGMRMMAEQACDLVITDMVMPEKEGVETCMELRKFYPKVPFISICGAPSAATYLQVANKLGAVAMIAKPFSSAEIFEAIDLARQRIEADED